MFIQGTRSQIWRTQAALSFFVDVLHSTAGCEPSLVARPVEHTAAAAAGGGFAVFMLMCGIALLQGCTPSSAARFCRILF